MNLQKIKQLEDLKLHVELLEEQKKDYIEGYCDTMYNNAKKAFREYFRNTNFNVVDSDEAGISANYNRVQINLSKVDSDNYVGEYVITAPFDKEYKIALDETGELTYKYHLYTTYNNDPLDKLIYTEINKKEQLDYFLSKKHLYTLGYIYIDNKSQLDITPSNPTQRFLDILNNIFTK